MNEFVEYFSTFSLPWEKGYCEKGGGWNSDVLFRRISFRKKDKWKLRNKISLPTVLLGKSSHILGGFYNSSCRLLS